MKSRLPKNIESFEKSNKLLSLILYFVDDEYRKYNPDILEKSENIKKQRFNVNEALQVARENKLSYYFSKRIAEDRPELVTELIRAEIRLGEKNIAKAKVTVEFLRSSFAAEGIDFLLIKTFKGLPYSTFDIDILLREATFGEAMRNMENKGALKTDGRFLNILLKLRLAFPGYRPKNLLDIDMYKGLLWWLPVLDEEFMWKRPRLIEFHGIDCLIPSREADLLSILASSFFTDRKINLLDFIYINSLLKNGVDFGILREETEKYGWNKEFFLVMSLLREIKNLLYHGLSPQNIIQFPYTIPLGVLVKALPKTINVKVSMEPLSLPFTLANVVFHSFIGELYKNLRQRVF
ncbi:nucleotidyltransferase family protein [Candidatus Hecatella orcuttiae]|uniref:nucleotidyltransferase family protein n=1 Tax=Candidatus Hecatella orcuttiae TaxID=1935119 RepID=UPI002867E0AE|nr:nucleotidyltransferase family protein [Candidatus Hecatella orcuttiae]